MELNLALMIVGGILLSVFGVIEGSTPQSNNVPAGLARAYF